MPSEEYRRYAQRTRNRLRERQQLNALGRGAPLRNGGIGAGGIHVDGGTIDIESLGAIEIHGGGGIDVFDGGDVVVHDAGTVDILGGGSLNITGGGGIHVYDGGDITTEGGTFTGATFQTRASSGAGIKLGGPTGNLTAYADEGSFAGEQTFLMDEDTGRVDMRDRLVVGGSQWLSGSNAPGIALIPYGVASGDVTYTGSGVYISREASTASASAGMWVDNPNTSSPRSLQIRGYQGGDVVINSPLYAYPNTTTTTSAANAFLNSSWMLTKTTSARRFKDAIEELSEDEAAKLLDVPVATWFDHNTAAGYSDYLTALDAGEEPDPTLLTSTVSLRRIPGVIAEDVDAAGATTFVVYEKDEDTGQPVPFSVLYDRIGVAWIPLMRAQRDRQTELESQVADLTTRLTALEGTP